MGESKHTPGPWRVDDEDFSGDLQIVGRPAWDCCRHGVTGEWAVAELDDLCGDNAGEMRANALLIAAAPEMFKALTRLTREAKLDGLDKRAGWDAWLSSAESILAKAEGRS